MNSSLPNFASRALTKATRARFATCLLLLASLAGCAATPQTTRVATQSSPTQTPQTAAPAKPNNPEAAKGQGSDDEVSRSVSEPYTGDLSIFEGKDRDRNLQINRVMDILRIKQGTSVADVGAGSGWFTVRAARRTKPDGTVYAVEINEEYLDYIAKRATREQLPNIKTVLGTEDDPKLTPASVDAVMILKTYHEISEPIRVLKHLREAMRPGARLGIIDRNGDGGDHGIARDTVVKELDRAGFRLIEDYDFVKPDGMDYFLVFEVKPQG